MLRIMLSMFAVLPFALSTAHATDLTTCNVTLTGGSYTLAADLSCSGIAGRVVTLDGARLDLQGHTITCATPAPGPCVTLTGWGAALGNGTVDGGGNQAVTVAGLGGHYLYDLTIAPIDTALIIESHWNLIYHIPATSNFSPAIRIAGQANWLASATADCPFVSGSCLLIDGHYNAVTWNLITTEDTINMSGAAVLVSGTNNWLASNIVV